MYKLGKQVEDSKMGNQNP